MPGEVFLEGQDIDLRTIEEQDIEFLQKVNNPKIWKNLSSVNKPVNKKQQTEFFEEQISSGNDIHLAISKNHDMVGIISLVEKDMNVPKIGLWIEEKHHGKGYGTEASEIMIDYAFNQLRDHKIYVRCLKSNKGSRRIWEKLGFNKEGELREQMYKEGCFEDVCVYGLLRSEWDK